jgi:hypothetical protein
LEIVDGAFQHGGKRVEANLANVVESLREMFPEWNFVMQPALGRMQVADLKLRPSTQEPPPGQPWRPDSVEETLAALRVACGNAFTWSRGWARPGLGGAGLPIDPTTGLPQAPPEEASSLFVLEPTPGALRPGRAVEVFNLHGYLQNLPRHDEKNPQESAKALDQNLAEIQMMIRQTLAMLRQDQPGLEEPQFQFHSGASLLVVIGSPEAIEISRKIVTALPYYASSGGGSLAMGSGSPATPSSTSFSDRLRRLIDEASTPGAGAPPPTRPPQYPTRPRAGTPPGEPAPNPPR